MITLTEEFEEIDKQADIASKELEKKTYSVLQQQQQRRNLLASYIKAIGIENISKIRLNGKTYEGKEIWDLV